MADPESEGLGVLIFQVRCFSWQLLGVFIPDFSGVVATLLLPSKLRNFIDYIKKSYGIVKTVKPNGGLYGSANPYLALQK